VDRGNGFTQRHGGTETHRAACGRRLAKPAVTLTPATGASTNGEPLSFVLRRLLASARPTSGPAAQHDCRIAPFVFYVPGRCQPPAVGALVASSLKPSVFTRVRGRRGCSDPGLAFYPSARDLTRLPETVQSRSRTLALRSLLRCGRRRRPYEHRTRNSRATRRLERRAYAVFRIAPCGTTPVVTYRHSAITNLRATATMPIRRARFPLAKCVSNHCVNGLCGCHRTQLHAS